MSNPEGPGTPAAGKRCTARSSRTGEPCGKWARKGSNVCMSHGAGTAVRVQRGERKDPTLVGIKHGRHATRFHSQILAKVEEHLNDPEMWALNRLYALRVGSLERADAMADMAGEALEFIKAKVAEFADPQLAALVINAASTAASTETLRQRAIEGLERVWQLKLRQDQAAGSVSVTEMMTLVRWMRAHVHQLVADPKVERSDIAARFDAAVDSLAFGYNMDRGALDESA